jgi:hypothetical protein
LGDVPLAMSAWNPETAPHAMVMNANGKRLPANTGPLPSMNCVTAGILSGGITNRIATPRIVMVPTFMNVDR